jgi:hypothetical protein
MARVPPASVERARTLLRRFFSAAAWRIDDEVALATIAGPGSGSTRTGLADDIVLSLTYRAGRLRIDVELVGDVGLVEGVGAAAGAPSVTGPVDGSVPTRPP